MLPKKFIYETRHIYFQMCVMIFIFIATFNSLTFSKKENSVCCALQGLVIELFREPHLLEE